ncbi:glycosyltransferase family 2 protein [Calothrix sp. CCY 0018]|uniref:glycosyltransferase family 2 protein n=1 Tax=Calothrix sp. CCY 0018 TaxID=3103864 RepID=UPI0039C6D9AB
MQQQQTDILKPIQLSALPAKPLVSVLIPNYNYAEYIGQTLESVLCQSYPHFEIIVCDDGSTDNSCEIIESYIDKDARIKLIRQKNQKVAVALNTAYWKSKGEIICILDADDIWIKQKLQRVVEGFQSQDRCGFFIHNVIEVDSKGASIKGRPMFTKMAAGWMGVYALANGGYVDNIPPASALSFRRDVTNLIFPLNEVMVRNTDSLIYRLAPLITSIGSTTEVLSQFRLHGANTSSVTLLSAECIKRGQESAFLVHQEQKKLLQKIYGSQMAHKLTGQELNIIWCHECYLLSRLQYASMEECQRTHQQLVTHPEFNHMFSWRKPHGFLVQWHLPDALFWLLFNQIYGSGRLKRFVKSLLLPKFSNYRGASTSTIAGTFD